MRQNWTVRELTIEKGGGIRAGATEKLAKVLRMYKCVPAAKVTNRYFASAAMHNGAYTVANSGLPGDGLAHSVTMVVTDVGGTDTRGTITITGTDINGEIISEVMTPGATGVTVESARAFKKVTSIVGAGWVTATGDDTIIIGFGDLIGMPECIAAAADLLLVAFDTGIVNAPTATYDASVVSKCTVTAVGDATKQLKVIYQI